MTFFISYLILCLTQTGCGSALGNTCLSFPGNGILMVLSLRSINR